MKELFLEIHGLVEDMNHRPSQQETGLHEQQLDTILHEIEVDEDGCVTRDNIPTIIFCYELWTYEKKLKSTMQEIYGDDQELELNGRVSITNPNGN